MDEIRNLAEEIILSGAQQETENERQHGELMVKLMEHRITCASQFPPEECLLEIDGVGFFAKGDVHAIKAKQKQGKTNAIAIMVAAILCGQWGRLSSPLAQPVVMICDTEQKGSDTKLIYERILHIGNLQEEKVLNRLYHFNLRELDASERYQALESLAKELKPDILFVDGVVDLLGNFNDVDDSKCLIDKLIRLTQMEGTNHLVAVVGVLHTNKNDEDHNMRGHLGTMLAQKAGTVLETVKKEGIFVVQNSDARHREVPEWSYRFNEHDEIVDASDWRMQLLEQKRVEKENLLKQKTEQQYQERKEILLSIVRDSSKGKLSRIALREALISKLQKGKSAVNSLISKVIEEGDIVETNGVISLQNSPNPTLNAQTEINFH